MLWMIIVYVVSTIGAIFLIYADLRTTKEVSTSELFLIFCLAFVPILNMLFCGISLVYSIIQSEKKVKNPFYEEPSDV